MCLAIGQFPSRQRYIWSYLFSERGESSTPELQRPSNSNDKVSGQKVETKNFQGPGSTSAFSQACPISSVSLVYKTQPRLSELDPVSSSARHKTCSAHAQARAGRPQAELSAVKVIARQS